VRFLMRHGTGGSNNAAAIAESLIGNRTHNLTMFQVQDWTNTESGMLASRAGYLKN
jgi:hypothetical protein